MLKIFSGKTGGYPLFLIFIVGSIFMVNLLIKFWSLINVWLNQLGAAFLTGFFVAGMVEQEVVTFNFQ